MSEEEAIKEIKRYLDYNGSVSISAIATLYTSYQKEKEMNKELRKPKYIMDFKTNKITKLANDFVSKDKIREKIEEANKEIKQMEQDDIGIGFTLGNRWSDLKAKVKGWEELLQEGDKYI